MSTSAQPIAMLDSGVGGLTVLSAIRAAMPRVDVVYFADTAHVPYGDRRLAEVAHFGRQIVAWLRSYDPMLVVVASGTTCAAFDSVGWRADGLTQIGIVECGSQAGVAATRNGKIGVVATAGTIDSGIFERKLRARQPNLEVTSVPAPALVPLVEAGQWGSDRARIAVEEAVRPIVAAQCDSVILGCTHFPHLRPWFEAALGSEVTIVDPADSCAQVVLQSLGERTSGDGRVDFAVSGPVAEFCANAHKLPGAWTGGAQHVDLDQVKELEEYQR